MDGELMGLHPDDLLRTLGVPSVGCVCLLLIHSSSQRTYASSLLHKHRSTASAHPPSCTPLWIEMSVVTLCSGRSSVRLVPRRCRPRSDLSTPEPAPPTSAHAPASPHCLPVSGGISSSPVTHTPQRAPLSASSVDNSPRLSRQASLPTQFLRPEILKSPSEPLLCVRPHDQPCSGSWHLLLLTSQVRPLPGSSSFPLAPLRLLLPSGWTMPVAS